MIKIEKNIPMPSRKTNYPVLEMEKGDSFFIECENSLEYNILRSRIHGRIINRVKNKGLNRIYAIRRVDGGLRVWRLD